MRCEKSRAKTHGVEMSCVEHSGFRHTWTLQGGGAGPYDGQGHCAQCDVHACAFVKCVTFDPPPTHPPPPSRWTTMWDAASVLVGLGVVAVVVVLVKWRGSVQPGPREQRWRYQTLAQLANGPCMLALLIDNIDASCR